MKETEQQKDYIGYEYKELTAESSQVSFLIDGYENFGWEPDENMPVRKETSARPNQDRMTIHLKRNRRIINKTELTRLQKNFEACVAEVELLERAKTSKALIYALVMGILGTAFMAGATFAATAQPPLWLLCAILALPGFTGWLLPFFIYRKTVQIQTKRLTPLVEEKYNEIYEICEKGNKLLIK